MKILYANPLFLYYRIPYYKRLNELFGGEFYVLYSVNRYKQRKEWVGVLDKIPEALGDNEHIESIAIPESVVEIGFAFAGLENLIEVIKF